MTELLPIPSEHLVASWPQVAVLVHAMADGSGGRLSCVDLIRAIQQREMQLWAARRGSEIIGAMLTEMQNHPQKREAHLLAATGHNADEWIDLMPKIEHWAKAEGAAGLKATCRLGWKKLLRPIGFSETHIVMEKPL